MFKRLTIWASAIILCAAAACAGDASINMSDSGKARKIVKMVRPAYPEKAKADGIAGMVKLQVVVSKEGKAKEVSVLSGPEELTESAVTAVGQWEWEPVVLDGKAVEVVQQVDVNFQLSK